MGSVQWCMRPERQETGAPGQEDDDRGWGTGDEQINKPKAK